MALGKLKAHNSYDFFLSGEDSKSLVNPWVFSVFTRVTKWKPFFLREGWGSLAPSLLHSRFLALRDDAKNGCAAD